MGKKRDCRVWRIRRRPEGEGWEGTGEELGTEEGKVVTHGEDLGLGVKIVGVTHLHASRGYAEGLVLEGLESIDGRGGGVGEPGGGSIGDKGADEGLIGY